MPIRGLLLAILTTGCFASAPTVTADKPLSAGHGVLIGRISVRGPGAVRPESSELVLSGRPGEKEWHVEFLDDKGPQGDLGVPFFVSLPAGGYEMAKWSFFGAGGEISGGADLLPFELPPGEIVCLGDLFPLAIKRNNDQLRALASDAAPCGQLVEALKARSPGLRGLPVRFGYAKAHPERARTEAPAAAPVVLTGLLGRYLVNRASMVDLLLPSIRLAPGVAKGPTAMSVRICVSAGGTVDEVAILESTDHTIDQAMAHELRSRSYVRLPIGAQAQPFCYVDSVITAPDTPPPAP